MELLSVPIIAVLVYGLIELIKLPLNKNNKFYTFIPLISGVLGGILGLIAYFVMPEIIPTGNLFHAFLVGLLSGLSATGSHQLVKQIIDKGNEGKAEQNSNEGNAANIPESKENTADITETKDSTTHDITQNNGDK